MKNLLVIFISLLFLGLLSCKNKETPDTCIELTPECEFTQKMWSLIHFSDEFTGVDAFGQDITEGWYFRNNKSFALFRASAVLKYNGGSSISSTSELWGPKSEAYFTPRYKDVNYKIDTVHTNMVDYPTLTHQGLISVLCLSRGEVFPRNLQTTSHLDRESLIVAWDM